MHIQSCTTDSSFAANRSDNIPTLYRINCLFTANVPYRISDNSEDYVHNYISIPSYFQQKNTWVRAACEHEHWKLASFVALPNEIISYILKFVVLNEGDHMIPRLSIVCKRFRDVVAQEEFRRSIHFSWLKSIYNWKNASEDFRRMYFVMYNVKRCHHCRILYKEMLGFGGRGKLGENRHFYSDLLFPGYCGAGCYPDVLT